MIPRAFVFDDPMLFCYTIRIGESIIRVPYKFIEYPSTYDLGDPRLDISPRNVYGELRSVDARVYSCENSEKPKIEKIRNTLCSETMWK